MAVLPGTPRVDVSRVDAEYGGKVDWILDVDVSKFLGLWPGLFINLHAETQYGKSILANAGPSVLPNTPMLLPLPNCGCTEITNLTLMQGLWEGEIPLQGDKGAAVVAVGKLNIVDLLTTSFPNFGYGLEGFLNFNALYPAWPYLRFWFISQYGASVVLFNEDRGMPQVSFLVYGQDNVSDKWDISDSFSDGVGLMGLFRVFWDLGGKPGYAAVLATGGTKEYSVVDGIIWEPPSPDLPPVPELDRDEGKPWAVNPFLYQEFWHGEDGGEHERKAYLWLTGAVADKEPSFAAQRLRLRAVLQRRDQPVVASDRRPPARPQPGQAFRLRGDPRWPPGAEFLMHHPRHPGPGYAAGSETRRHTSGT